MMIFRARGLHQGKVMFFLFPYAFRGDNERGIGMGQTAFKYGILLCDNVSSYMRHVAWALQKVLINNNFAKIEWPA